MALKRELSFKGRSDESSPSKQTYQGKISKSPMTPGKYGNASQYIQNSEEIILPLEFNDSDLDLQNILGKYFPKDSYFIPEYPGKDQNYYETILCETQSAQIFHNKNGGELGFTKLLIQKVIHLEEWDRSSNPYVAKTIYSATCLNKKYNYWDYQKAWERVLLVQNYQMKHSWFIRFKEGCGEIPLWFFNNCWPKAGAIPEILPEDIIRMITQESEKNLKDYPFILMQFCVETSLPWIIKWEFDIQKTQFPATLRRKYYARWWDKFNIQAIINKRRYEASSKKSNMAKLKEDITKELLLKQPNLSQADLKLLVYERMFKMLDDTPHPLQIKSPKPEDEEDQVQCSQAVPGFVYYSPMKQEEEGSQGGISDYSPMSK
uniref:Uncharacterized protein n=1 Tax=Sorghum bicolor TaxID=4558 RepID=A0A224QT38_SORBI|nr:TPA: hypothetical protein [Sorghum bicolor]